MSDILAHALAYAKAGLLVFPAPPGSKMSYKSARFSGGARWGATRDEVQIRTDWGRWPSANVGIVTGSESRIFVIDVDTAKGHDVDGFASLSALTKAHGPFPETRKARSPSGSIHYYFVWPAIGIVRNDTGRKIGPGVDIRGEGGMVVAPPSVRDDGVYRWLNDSPIKNAPDWLLHIIAEEATRRDKRNSSDDQRCADPLIAAMVAAIPNPDLGWEDWNRIAMAIYAATYGDDAGFAIFDSWSRRSGKYRASATWKKWEQLHRSPPEIIGVGTLFFEANQASPGWLNLNDAKLEAELERANRYWADKSVEEWFEHLQTRKLERHNDVHI